jgi:hypothetical protein
MNTNNDPILSLLLDGVSEPAEREAIITAHTTFKTAGPDSLPGAMAVYQARLIQIVVKCTEKATPSAEHQETLAALLKEIQQLRKADLPVVEQAKEEIIATNRGTRRLRMSVVFFFMMLALLAGGGAGGYAVYRYEEPTVRVTEELALVKKLDAQHVFLVPADHKDGEIGIALVSDRAYTDVKKLPDHDGWSGFQAWWPEEAGASQ